MSHAPPADRPARSVTVVTPQTVLVVVLTGGTARRLGGVEKTALDVGGSSVLERLLDTLGPWPVVVVGAPQDVGRDVVWTREDPPLGGPFAAVAAGVAAGVDVHPPTDVVVVLAGDQPFAGAAVPALLDVLTTRPDVEGALASGPDGRPQPLLAAYRLAAVRDRLTGSVDGRPARELVAGLRIAAVRVSATTTLDVDDPTDLAAARDAAQDLSPASDPAP